MAKYAEAAPIILQALEDGYTMLDAAAKAGVTKKTLYEWLADKSDFRDHVHDARANADKNAIDKVEHSLLELALGYEYEEVATEYESKPVVDEHGKEQYVPTIKKQKRIKKRVVQSIEAIRFYLSNKCPEVWKNRTDGNINLGDIMSGLKVTHVYDKKESDEFPSSEADVDAER